MRRRPKIKTWLRPQEVAPPGQLGVSCLLTSAAATPVDFVSFVFRGTLTVATARGAFERVLVHAEKRTEAFVLQKGELRLDTTFDLAEGLPPTYAAAGLTVSYGVEIRVSIPWWPDRVARYRVAVRTPLGGPVAESPAAFGANARSGEPSLEVALRSTTLEVHDRVEGTLSVLAGNARVRGVDVTLVQTHTVSSLGGGAFDVARYTARVAEPPIVDGKPVPFRIRPPPTLSPCFSAGGVSVSTALEVRVVTLFADDVVARVPLRIVPVSGDGPRRRTSALPPVGKPRHALMWATAARELGAVATDGEEHLTARVGEVSVEAGVETRGAGRWIVVRLSWPSLGLGMRLTRKSWRDVLVGRRVPIDDVDAAGALTLVAREPEQTRRAFVGRRLSRLVTFTEVEVADDGAELAVAEPSRSARAVTTTVRAALGFAREITEVAARVPPPAALADALGAWMAAAEELRGRLELGRMWIHEGRRGPDRVTMGARWGDDGALLGLSVEVANEPPLGFHPLASDDVRLSPDAKLAWAALGELAEVRVDPTNVVAFVPGAADDPRARFDVLDLAVRLRRALAGRGVAGPFR